MSKRPFSTFSPYSFSKTGLEPKKYLKFFKNYFEFWSMTEFWAQKRPPRAILGQLRARVSYLQSSGAPQDPRFTVGGVHMRHIYISMAIFCEYQYSKIFGPAGLRLLIPYTFHNFVCWCWKCVFSSELSHVFCANGWRSSSCLYIVTNHAYGMRLQKRLPRSAGGPKDHLLSPTPTMRLVKKKR